MLNEHREEEDEQEIVRCPTCQRRVLAIYALQKPIDVMQYIKCDGHHGIDFSPGALRAHCPALTTALISRLGGIFQKVNKKRCKVHISRNKK